MRDLAALVEQCRRRVTFALSSGEGSFDQVLKEWISGKYLEPHPLGHSFCKCSPERIDLDAARCLQAKRVAEGDAAVALETKPDYAYAPDAVCAECSNNVCLSVNERYWNDNLLEAQRAAELASTQRQRAFASDRRDRIESHLARCRKLWRTEE